MQLLFCLRRCYKLMVWCATASELPPHGKFLISRLISPVAKETSVIQNQYVCNPHCAVISHLCRAFCMNLYIFYYYFVVSFYACLPIPLLVMLKSIIIVAFVSCMCNERRIIPMYDLLLMCCFPSCSLLQCSKPAQGIINLS